jgi:hypothetical protein
MLGAELFPRPALLAVSEPIRDQRRLIGFFLE